VEEQQRVIGRTKSDSAELADVPPTAHIRRAEIRIDDEEQPIYRRSVPFGTLREHGLYFLAFARNPLVFALQLDRMFGLAEDGLVDRLTEFSTPASGSYFFAPSSEALQRLFRRYPHA
jgi:porphyrinogen peroxidase